MKELGIYNELCQYENTIPIFSRAWWLNTVCDFNWDIALVEKNGEIVGSMPYYINKKYFFTLLEMPSFTQIMGCWIKNNNSLSYEKKIMTELIKKLPGFDYFDQNFHYSITNWLPFYWNGFKQTTRYTYVIEDLSNLDGVFNNFSHSKRKNIKKAEKQVEIRFDLSAKRFYDNHKMTLAKQGQTILYDYGSFVKLYNMAYKNKSAKTIYAIDKDNNIHSAMFFIWDENSAYNLISTIDPDFRNCGSSSLLIKEIIRYVSEFTKCFDFEGSMIENVEQSFRRFGAVQKSYFQITKCNSRLLKVYYGLLKDELKMAGA